MSINKLRVFYFLLFSTIGFILYALYTLCAKIEKLNSTITDLYITNSEKDLRSINNLIFESHFKDDLILNSFSTSTTIIIAFFTTLIALGTLFSFKRIDDDISKLKKTKKELADAKVKIKKQEKTTLQLYNKIKHTQTNIDNQVHSIEEIKDQLLDTIMEHAINNSIASRKSLRILITELHLQNTLSHIDIVKIHNEINNYILFNSMFLLHIEENEIRISSTHGSLEDAKKEIIKDIDNLLVLFRKISSKCTNNQKVFFTKNLTELANIKIFKDFKNQLIKIFT